MKAFADNASVISDSEQTEHNNRLISTQLNSSLLKMVAEWLKEYST